MSTTTTLPPIFDSSSCSTTNLLNPCAPTYHLKPTHTKQQSVTFAETAIPPRIRRQYSTPEMQCVRQPHISTSPGSYRNTPPTPTAARHRPSLSFSSMLPRTNLLRRLSTDSTRVLSPTPPGKRSDSPSAWLMPRLTPNRARTTPPLATQSFAAVDSSFQSNRLVRRNDNSSTSQVGDNPRQSSLIDTDTESLNTIYDRLPCSATQSLPPSPIDSQRVWLCSPPKRRSSAVPTTPGTSPLKPTQSAPASAPFSSSASFVCPGQPISDEPEADGGEEDRGELFGTIPAPAPASRLAQSAPVRRPPLVTRAMSTGRLAHEFDENGSIICLSVHSDRILAKGTRVQDGDTRAGVKKRMSQGCPPSWRESRGEGLIRTSSEQ